MPDRILAADCVMRPMANTRAAGIFTRRARKLRSGAVIHHNQRRMDDRSGIHQRSRQRVAARLNHAGKRASDHVDRVIGGFSAENTPTGSRLARMVMATSNGPLLRVSHGSVPVSAKAHACALPASRAGFRKDHRAEGCRGRNTTCHRLKCGASRPAISCCAKAGAGHRISSAPPKLWQCLMSTSASCTSWRPLASLRQCASPPRDAGLPQPHCAATADIVPCKRKIARGRKRPIAAAEPRRSSRRVSLPRARARKAVAA